MVIGNRKIRVLKTTLILRKHRPIVGVSNFGSDFVHFEKRAIQSKNMTGADD